MVSLSGPPIVSPLTKIRRWVGDVATGTNPENGEPLNITLEERMAALAKGLEVATEPDERAAYANGIIIVRKLMDARDARTRTRLVK